MNNNSRNNNNYSRNNSTPNRQTPRNSSTSTTNKKTKKQIKREKRIRFKKEHPVRYYIRFALKLLFLMMLIAGLVLILLFYNKYGKRILNMQAEAKKYVSESTLDTFRQSETSLVYDVNGEVISELKGEKDVYYLEYKDIPQPVTDAFITIEDKNFLKHKGVDLKANIRAMLILIKNRGKIKQGASTITQQLSRNIFLNQRRTYERKIEEIFIATELEKKYEKWQILEFYINNIYFANGYYGIQAASEGYFSKDVNDLTLSEVAFLCAIPNSPNLYDPIDHMDNTIKRRNRILKQMFEDGKILEEEYQEAYDQEIVLDIKKIKKKDYVETFVNHCAIRALMQAQGFVFQSEFDSDKEEKEYKDKYNETYSRCQHALYREGYRIYTSIDMKQQKMLQASVDDTLADFKDVTDDGVYKLQSSAVCIDNQTGYVTAIVGGRKQKSTGYTLNRAFQSYRQPGSSIKPLIVYTPALENGHHPEDIVVDEKFEDGPSNSNGRYTGKTTLRKAVEQSINTIAWKLFQELTPKVGLSYLKRMNFAKIDKNDYYPAASLGGFTHGCSAVEMASAYATIENDGIYREPTCIVKITNTEGKVIVSSNRSDYQIYKKNAARMMTDILTGVMKYGTARGLGIPNMPSAGKTGTTNEKKDGWFVGYTPYYTTSVWVGYDTPQRLEGLMGSTYPGQIWKNFMVPLHDGLESIPFPKFKDTKPKVEVLEEEEPEVTDPPEEEITDENGGVIENGDDSGQIPEEQQPLPTPDVSPDNDTEPKPDTEEPEIDTGEDNDIVDDSNDTDDGYNDESGDTGLGEEDEVLPPEEEDGANDILQ